MSLAAAEVGLQLDDRVAAFQIPAPDCVKNELLQPVSNEGAAEELDWVTVLGQGLIAPDLVEVSRELCLLVAPRGHILVWCNDLAPRLQSTSRLTLDGR